MTEETVKKLPLAWIARDWWEKLQRYTPDNKPNTFSDPAALARLRRCASPADAMGEEATLDLFRRLRREDPPRCLRPDFDLPRVALIAMVLAQVRTDAGAKEPPAKTVGRSKPDDKESAQMSELRFRRLLACRDDTDEARDELAREMRRFVMLADKRVNVGDLAKALFYWNDRTRARWAFDYYSAGFAAPTGGPTEDAA